MIEYLNEKIANPPLSNLQDVLSNLIPKQAKPVILAKVADEYLLKTLDPALAPEKS